MTQALRLPPCDCTAGSRLASKATWIRINRLLAWALLISPAVQIAMGTDFWRGLWFDLGLLAVHGALSLALFGLPKTTGRGNRLMLWTGLAPNGLSPRNQFLMTGWGIALGFIYLPVLPLVPMASLVLGAPLVLIWFLLPFRALGHVFQAGEYAFRRWGLRKEGDSWVAAFFLAGFFMIVNTVNLVR